MATEDEERAVLARRGWVCRGARGSRSRWARGRAGRWGSLSPPGWLCWEPPVCRGGCWTVESLRYGVFMEPSISPLFSSQVFRVPLHVVRQVQPGHSRARTIFGLIVARLRYGAGGNALPRDVLPGDALPVRLLQRMHYASFTALDFQRLGDSGFC